MRWLVPVLVSAILAPGAFSMRASAATPLQPSPSPAAARVEPSSELALRLYQAAISKPQQGNWVYSPSSLSSAMNLASLGAKGATLTQIRAALGPLDRPRASPLPPSPSPAPGDEAPSVGSELVSASRVWVQKNHRILPGYLKKAEAHFDAGAEPLDFQGSLETARLRINAWVSERTRRRIPELLGPGALRPDLRLVLTNTVYLKAAWRSPFYREMTRPSDFHAYDPSRRNPKSRVKASMMHQTSHFRYAREPGYALLELPYVDGLSMIALLPHKTHGLPEIEASLTADALSQSLSRLRSRRVEVFLPKFRFETGLEAISVFRSIGVTDAFDPTRADFSAMDGTRNLHIGAVIHRAAIEVDEKGTEASAASAILVRPGSAMPQHEPLLFRADHPFLFLIRDSASGEILFMGRVSAPSDAS